MVETLVAYLSAGAEDETSVTLFLPQPRYEILPLDDATLDQAIWCLGRIGENGSWPESVSRK